MQGRTGQDWCHSSLLEHVVYMILTPAVLLSLFAPAVLRLAWPPGEEVPRPPVTTTGQRRKWGRMLICCLLRFAAWPVWHAASCIRTGFMICSKHRFAVSTVNTLSPMSACVSGKRKPLHVLVCQPQVIWS